MSMLPKTFPAFPNRKDIELYAALVPAKAVGGDLYDFLIHDEKLFFCIGDVSGKGIPASLVMAVSRTLFRNVTAHTAEPDHIVETMNKSICDGNDNLMFVTLFVGVLDLQTGHLSYCNAGHDAPYVQGELLPCIPNLPIGVKPTFQYINQEADIASGVNVFLYTDGLTEAKNADNQFFGQQRITDIVAIVERAREISGCDLRLVIAGHLGRTAYVDAVKALAAHREWVLLVGGVYGDAKKTLLLSATYAIHAERDETFGISVTEYLKAGNIVLVPDEGGTPEIVGSQELAYRTDGEAAQMLAHLLSDETFREKMRRHCAGRAKTFSRTAYMKRQRKLLDGMLKQ
jgi:glycosyltransferase involved in cell wall biosynthesis